MASPEATERTALRDLAPPNASGGGLEGIAEFDFERAARRGYPEAVLCEGKTMEHLVAIARAVGERVAAEEGRTVGEHGTNDEQAADAKGHHPMGTILFTRASAEQAQAVLQELPGAVHDPLARMLAWPAGLPDHSGGTVLVLCAGTADIPVAREAWLTAQHLGRPAELVVDVGVAGLHRILARVDQIAAASAIVVVAGMDGALASVVAGLASAPVIGVPTSVGYGAAFDGLAPLLSMLNACSPGVAVVNIDNGYGAGHRAAQIAARG